MKQTSTVNVIYGSPCSGKTTFILSKKKPNDYILDLDSIAQSILNTTTKDSTIRTKEQINILLRVRNQMLRELIQHQVVIWIPTTYLGGIFNDFTYNLKEMDISKEECLHRLHLSDRPNKELQQQAIEEWFEKRIPKMGGAA